MTRVKNIKVILLLLSILMLPTLYHVGINSNKENNGINDNKEFLMCPSGFWNLTGSKIFIDDLDS